MNAAIGRALLRPSAVTAVDLALLTAIWIASILIVNPIGEFPLNDDWTYALVVKELLENRDFRPGWWAGAQLLTNTLWGALFCLPNGLTFTALRFSTLVASLVGILGCYTLMRDITLHRWFAHAVTLSLAFNPIYYALSHTFMTDVPFLALVVWALVFLARNLRSGRDSQMLIGTALALAATLSRQIAICIPVAFLAVHVLYPRARPRVLRALIPSAVCITSLVAFKWWLVHTGRTPGYIDPTSERLVRMLGDPGELITFLPNNIFIALLYLGLFFLPVLALSTKQMLRPPTTAMRGLVACGVLILIAGFFAHAHYVRTGASDTPFMPVGSNILSSFGIGPIVLRDVIYLKLNTPPSLPSDFWIAVTAASVCGAVLLTLRLCNTLNQLAQAPFSSPGLEGDALARTLFLLSGLFYLTPVLFTNPLFDEYLIPLIPFTAAGLAPIGSWPLPSNGAAFRRTAALLLILAFAVFSICGTRDYLMLNRTRWMALEELQRDFQIGPDEIDGGYEFNGWYLYDPNQPVDLEADGTERSAWWVRRDTYQIGLGPVPGYTVLREYTYPNWMPPRRQKIVVLRKASGTDLK